MRQQMEQMQGTSHGFDLSFDATLSRLEERAQTEKASKSASDHVLDSAVLTELKALKQQMAEMHSTSHQFDISFDEALNRMDGRVGRLETKSAATTSTAADAPATLRNGLGQ